MEASLEVGPFALRAAHSRRPAIGRRVHRADRVHLGVVGVGPRRPGVGRAPDGAQGPRGGVRQPRGTLLSRGRRPGQPPS